MAPGIFEQSTRAAYVRAVELAMSACTAHVALLSY